MTGANLVSFYEGGGLKNLYMHRFLHSCRDKVTRDSRT